MNESMIIYHLGVEEIEPDHWIAWVLDLPGCFSSAPTSREAAKRAPGEISAYFAWRLSHNAFQPPFPARFECQVAETHHAYTKPTDPNYLVNAFFEHDRRPLTFEEVAEILLLLTWTRRDLLHLLDLPSGTLSGDVLEIVNHVASAENWYLMQFDLGLKPDSLPADPLSRLRIVRENTRRQLPALAGVPRVSQSRGESWSARKIARRTLWHERDHTNHIRKMMEE